MTPNRAVFLTGFMGAGKTSVGAALARRRACAFYDLDALVVERAGRSVAEIFQTSGETEFRRLESDALSGLLARLGETGAGAVIALGGGTQTVAENMCGMREAGGILVALEAPVEVLFGRTRKASGTRPLAQDEIAFRQLHASRQPHYLAADVRVDSATGDMEAVAGRIEDAIAAWSGDRREKR